jgi:hypothetical protein
MVSSDEEQLCLVVHERPERHSAEQAIPPGAEPRGHRRLATDEQHPHVIVQRGNEHLAQPGVHEPEHLEMVECEDHGVAERAEPAGDRVHASLVASRRVRQCLEEAALGRLDGTAVELDRHGAGEAQAVEENRDERRLPDARVAMDVHDGRRPGRADQPLE